jgi:uncharacterized protein involved in cysteine biosynthesis
VIIGDFLRALSQMLDRRFLSVLLGGIGLALALLAGLHVAIVWTLDWLLPDSFTLPLIGEITWVDNALSWASVGLMLVLSMFLMVPVASMFTGLFLDTVADAVEARHYPHLSPAPHVPLGTALRDSIAFLGVILGVNALALFLYLFVGPFAPLLFWAVNGYLLGREYFQLTALRRLGPQGAKAARKRHRLSVFAAGVLMAIPLSIPLINLVVPVLGAATFTHLFHRLEPAARTG